jgi:hypothetical protein
MFDPEIVNPEYGTIVSFSKYKLMSTTVDMVEVDWYCGMVIPYPKDELVKILKSNRYLNMEILGELNE